MKNYTQSPLPFQGQKRKFLNHVKEVLANSSEDATYVDLFGGSGILSHTVKQLKPNAKVVYNDYDDFSKRLASVAQTNVLLGKIRAITKELPKDKLIPEVHKLKLLELIKDEECRLGYVDYITLSSSLLFSAKYVTNYNDLTKQTFYNNVRQSNYVTDDYLAGVEIVHQDYKELFDHYKDLKNVVFLVDPPYLSTDCSTYNSNNYWKLKDYLNVLDVLVDTNYLYFTSNKSQIVELCQWMEDRTSIAEVNPFNGSTTVCINTTLNHSAKYTDMMLYKLDL
ncbi:MULTISPECIES: DNA adenine methylase [Empedobacter]|uniref:DNA adenine methylase n=1 Tax=Empedobacter TaxID=59734 RepID=UPI002575037A|nr:MULTISPECIES: DNA adenine methylase [Empedobacter]MDM1042115.1 DNA adenine methylase [Empedobacter brevis]MDM1136010.1 DNA adenine methylase [Empedobacter sp. R750]